MTRVWLILIIGLALSLLGTSTATDIISLRAVFVNVPVMSTLVFATRNAMGTTVAHTLEPLCAVLGLSVMVFAARLGSRPTRPARRLVLNAVTPQQ
jgi:hypothetical protein